MKAVVSRRHGTQMSKTRGALGRLWLARFGRDLCRAAGVPPIVGAAGGAVVGLLWS